ncbi:MAG TPA: Trm112 family protein [Gemmatimonadaceae bacterium]|nr:Trm112 family protein [Gemmatimonadaceae bacterium]
MFIEVVDAFRCPRPHELTWLVASADRLEDRDILAGELGCPVCGARYPIVDGVVDFRPAAARAPASGATAAPVPRDVPDRALRAAALLGLTEPGGLVVLAGGWGDAAHEVAALAEGVHVLAVDPLGVVSSGFGVSVVRAADTLPMRPESVRAVALDDAHAAPPFLETSVAALRPSGRLLVPAGAGIPAGIVERARDAHEWLGEKQDLTTLARAPRL